LNQLEKTLSNPNHPYSHFGTGSSVTLGENTAARGLDIRSILIEFYEKHYSSNLMKLVVYGKESLDELQRMVVPKFVKVVNRNFALQEWNDLPLDERHFGKLIRMRTIKDMQTLYIIWQLPDMQKYRQEKPDHYYSHLLGHEGHGSILSLLKAKGWATALSAGSDNDSRGYSFFQVSVELTPDGLSHVEEIIKTVFQYLQMLRLEGPQHWIYEESRRLEEIAFRFAENGSPSIFAHNTARNMQSYPPKMVLKGPRVTTAYDFQLLTNMLEHLGATNFRALLATNEELPSEKVQYEPWYRTEYTIEPLRDSLIKAIATHSEEPFLHLPHPNKYLPDALEIKSPTATEPVMHPELSVDQGQYRLWHKQDDIFEQPKACFKFVVHNNVTYSSATNLVRSTLFLDLLQDSLSELLYEAHVAGLRFDVELEARGLVFAFYGYDDKLPLLLREVMQRVVQFQADPARFAAIHDRYSRWLKSFVHDMPYSLVTYYLNGVQKEHYWWYWQKAAVLPSITIGDVNSVVGEIFAAANIEALCHGNYRAEEAVTILAVLQEVLKNTAPLPDPDNVHVIALKPRQDLIYAPPPVPNASSAISMYLQIGSLGDLRLRALTELFVQLFQEPFFDLLRTKEQLGYIVRHQIRKKDNSVGLEFLIQSEHDPIYLDERIESFLAQTISSLSDMGDEEFNEHVQSLINKLLAKKRKLTDETYIYWHHVYIQQYEFERRFVDAEYLRRLTKADLLFFIRQYVLPGGSERKKLAVHLWSDSKDEERRAAYEKLPKDVQLFEKPEGLAKVVGQFPLVYSIKDLGSQL
jgi:insulysin